MALSARREQKISNAVRSYGKRLSAFIRRRVSSDEDAEDVLQDVWLQLSSVVDLDPIERLSSWLYRVARNRIADRYRKKTALPVSRLAENHAESEDSIEEMLFVEQQVLEDDILRRLFNEELIKALDELPEAQRQVFIANEIEGRTFEELSRETGVNIKTLISRKRYAVKKLRERLADFDDDFFPDTNNSEE